MAMHRLLQKAIYIPSMIDHEQSIENKVKLTTSANKKHGQANPDEKSSTLPLSSRSTIALIPGRLSSKGGTALSVRVRSH